MADFGQAYDRLPEAVVVIAADGTVRQVNDRARVLFALDDAVVGARVDDVLELRDDADVRCSLPPPSSPVADRLAERVVRAHTAAGPRPVAIAGRWVDDELVLTARSAGRRERLDGVRGDVVATVSHEIRSPLTSVKGFTRTLLARWERFSDAQKRTMLETIDADADRVTRLLTELLDVSRIDAGRVQLHRTRVDVGGLVERVGDRLAVHEDAADRPIVVRVAEQLPPVSADADKLEQVLLNLVDNALRYAGHGPVEVDVASDGDHVCIDVVDHGPGVAPDQRRLVFQKFGRGREVRRSGTGLGLYITRGLVEAHGGEVALEDAPGGGARFRVLLPATPAD